MKRLFVIVLGVVLSTLGTFAQPQTSRSACGLSLGVNAGWLHDTPVVKPYAAYHRLMSDDCPIVCLFDLNSASGQIH